MEVVAGGIIRFRQPVKRIVNVIDDRLIIAGQGRGQVGGNGGGIQRRRGCDRISGYINRRAGKAERDGIHRCSVHHSKGYRYQHIVQRTPSTLARQSCCP